MKSHPVNSKVVRPGGVPATGERNGYAIPSGDNDEGVDEIFFKTNHIVRPSRVGPSVQPIEKLSE